MHLMSLKDPMRMFTRKKGYFDVWCSERLNQFEQGE